MHAIKTPSFFRPASRPSSPAPAPAPSRPDSGIGMERSRPFNKLSLTTFRRASPAPGPPATNNAPAPLIQDGSYLEMLGLKLSEAVSKAIAQPNGPPAAYEQVSGRRPLPSGRGHALGTLIASELRAANDNQHLYRAILRSLHRPLSVLLGNLSSLLVPLLSATQLLALPSTVPSVPTLNPTQLHAIGISSLAGELLETFDDFALGLDGDIRGDGLKQVREGLMSLVNRIVNPFLGMMKNELAPFVESLETPSGKTAKASPSIIALQAVMPAYSKAIARYTTTPASQTVLATHVISLIWKSLVALTARPYVPPSPPSSPLSAPVGAAKKRRGSPTASPPLTPPTARFTIKLPSSRPPSPPTAPSAQTLSADARALYDLLNMLPRPDASKKTTRLAREAVDEAYDGLKAFPTFIDLVYAAPSVASADDTAQQLLAAAADIPTLIALPVVLHVYGRGDSVASLLGLTEASYRSGCLTGFGRAEECAGAVGERVLNMFNAGDTIPRKWLEAELAEDMLPSSL
ncbi:hypothetical protein BDZ89DRAFT_1141699 [Hymenopellis radicata]|nr:hypothetical protein BDZ89DRAFT_1141699 [Hymenopellis radicata]